MKDQKTFFDLIVRHFRTKKEAAEAIADLTYVTTGTVRRWMTGATPIRYEILRLLVKKFNVLPPDLYSSPRDLVHFRYTNLDVETPLHYQRYMERVADMMEGLGDGPGARVDFVADDIPIFHFMPFTRLTYFKLFAYSHDVLKHSHPYEHFVDMVEPAGLEVLFRRIARAYGACHSVEIWGDGVLDDTLFYIRYMWDMDRFLSPSSAQQLLDELSALLKHFRATLSRGSKEGSGRLDFFRHERISRPGYMIATGHGGKVLSLKLNTINSLSTDSSVIVAEAAKGLEAAVAQSVNLGSGAERERNLYFRALDDKIESCRDYIRGHRAS